MTRTRVIRLSVVVVVLAALIGAWQTAYARGRNDGRTEIATLQADFIQARQGGAAASGTPTGGAGGQRPGVNGTIEQMDGQTLTVATSDGTVKVSLNDSTRIGKQVTASPGDLKVGDRVLVIGEKRGDTEYTATTIQIQAQDQAGR